MIRGLVNDEGVPIVSVEIAARQWLAVIDTGFNGDLELPLKLKPFVKPRYIGRTTSSLAAGQTIVEKSYNITVPFDGRIMRGVATFVDGDQLLIGTNFLRDYRLEIDFPRRVLSLSNTEETLP
jgi:predicted aspartyl protease